MSNDYTIYDTATGEIFSHLSTIRVSDVAATLTLTQSALLGPIPDQKTQYVSAGALVARVVNTTVIPPPTLSLNTIISIIGIPNPSLITINNDHENIMTNGLITNSNISFQSGARGLFHFHIRSFPIQDVEFTIAIF